MTTLSTFDLHGLTSAHLILTFEGVLPVVGGEYDTSQCDTLRAAVLNHLIDAHPDVEWTVSFDGADYAPVLFVYHAETDDVGEELFDLYEECMLIASNAADWTYDEAE